VRIPVLCYHRIEEPPLDHERDANYVTPELFASHMQTLAARGYTGVAIRDVVAWQRGATVHPQKPIAITFDDAYESVVTDGLPVLEALGWKATIYAVAGEIGGTNAWDSSAPTAQLMDADQLRHAHAAGHEVGSHTHQHVRVRGLASARVRDELTRSRDTLESVLCVNVTSFAFPYGSHDAASLQAVHDAGYESACTLKRWWNGRHANPLRLGRIGIGGPMSTHELQAKLIKAALMPART
jgi:peptidoglycan/xylan/chitin deacetylase (PgdA/CDA1 family)